MRSLVRSLPVLALALALPLTAHAADKSGSKGRADSVQVNAKSSDAYLQYHGRVFIAAGKSTTEYRWGGTSCGSRTLTPELVALLVEAVAENDELVVDPIYPRRARLDQVPVRVLARGRGRRRQSLVPNQAQNQKS